MNSDDVKTIALGCALVLPGCCAWWAIYLLLQLWSKT
jgi:hypothetical protein